jgi:predicted Rossmann fold flavoprotein
MRCGAKHVISSIVHESNVEGSKAPSKNIFVPPFGVHSCIQYLLALSMKPVLVVGGGGAGLIAAWRAGALGARVLLLERNRKLGIKLLISGGGKCNITHAGTAEDLLRAFSAREARFLKPSLYRFTNTDVIRQLEGEGVRTYTRPNGRVFPVSGRASDVVEAFASLLRRVGVEVQVNARVTSIVGENDMLHGVVVDGRMIQADHVILSTGGVSYPRTGTTGDGIRWAEELGHTIVRLRPALAPIAVDPPVPAAWMGVAVRGGRLMLVAGGRHKFHWDDDVLFTHEGISGPAALEVSRTASTLMEKEEVLIALDFFPRESFPSLDGRLQDLVEHNRGKMVATMLEAWLPNRVVSALLATADVDPATRGHVLTREDRRRIVTTLKEWSLGRIKAIDITRGEVTAGGVSLAEVDPQTMLSRKVAGLCLCGEMLDIAGPVGGYNLQAAFSTGFVAGETAARAWLKRTKSVYGLETRATRTVL